MTKLSLTGNPTTINSCCFSPSFQPFLDLLNTTISIVVLGLEEEAVVVSHHHLAYDLEYRCQRRYSCPAKEPDQHRA